MKANINLTGVRSGEIIRGLSGAKQSGGVSCEVRASDGRELAYPPTRSIVDQVDRLVVRDRLTSLAFFSRLSLDERMNYLVKSAVNAKELYLSDVKDLEVKFLSISNQEWTQRLGEKVIESLLDHQYHSLAEVYALFPRKPGSRAARHVLIFRPSIWEVSPQISCQARYTGKCLDLDQSSYTRGTFSLKLNQVVTSVTLNEVIYLRAISYAKPELDTLLEELAAFINRDLQELKSIQEAIKWFTPSVHKSLIQKIIRTRAPQVGDYDGLTTLLVSFTMLLHHGGAFNPQLQTFVTGLESATKRLAVSIAEDSHVSDLTQLTWLLVPSLLIRAHPTYFPSLELINDWWELARQAYHDPLIYQWKTSQLEVDRPFSLQTGGYYLLREIKSFEGDIGLMSHIVVNRGATRSLLQQEPSSIPLWHCLDHHNHTELALYLPYQPSDQASTFAPIFSQVWEHSSKVNPRRGDHFKNTSTFRDIRRAQELLWLSLSSSQPRLRVSAGVETLTFEIKNGWLSGLLGPIEVRGGFVVLHPDDPKKMIAIKKPSRDATQMPQFTETEAKLAKLEALKRLSRGIELVDVPETLDFLEGLVVTRNQGSYFLDAIPWDRYRHVSFDFSLHKACQPSLRQAMLTRGYGLVVDHEAKLEVLLDDLSPQVLTRLIIYLSYDSQIKMFPISRDGSGTDYGVMREDMAVFHLLAKLSCIYPGALHLEGSRSFKIINGPLFWSITDQIKARLSTQVNLTQMTVTPDDQKPWPHQVESVDVMIKRTQAGHRGNIVWIDPGMGKTRILMMYLAELIKLKLCPKYVVYTLPSEAVKSIQHEFDLFDIPHQLLDMTQKGCHQKLKPHRINLIWHDHLRLGTMPQQLKTYASDMILVVDEFHRAMAKTQRTSIILETVAICRYFVAMTGTIVKDNHLDELIRWLSYVVDFEVTTKNYWVAVGALVSKKVKTKVVVERHYVEVNIVNPDYYRVVPATLGGTGVFNFSQALKTCYVDVTQAMITKIQQLVDNGEGVFVVARDKAHQETLAKGLKKLRCHLITKDNPVDLTPKTKSRVQVVITTCRYSTGYNLSKFGVMVTSIYPSNQATREQLEYRVNRIGQTRDQVDFYYYHGGILTHLLRSYERCRSQNEALKAFAQEIQVDVKLVQGIH